MWKRDEAVRPAPAAAPAPSQQAAEAATPRADDRRHQAERDVVNIGKSVVIKGELNGSEDLTIEGQVEGKIELRQNVLTIGPNGKIKAQVFAKSVVVLGEVTGNITATEKVDIRDNGSVDGDLVSPRVAIAEGAHFRGSIDMQRSGQPAQQAQQARPGEAKPPEQKAPMAPGSPSPAVAGAGAAKP
jgi:cytoskeletal protein CcmA (bactofilin family)